MKWPILVLLALVFVAPAFADEQARISVKDAVVTDYYGRSIVNTFPRLRGHNPNVIYGQDVSLWIEPSLADTKDIYIGSDGKPAWFMMQVPPEANLEMFWVRQKESVLGWVHSYAWGDWCPIYAGGEYREFASNAGLWDSIQVVFAGYVGAAPGSLRVYHRMELISND